MLSPEIVQYCSTGRHIEKAKITAEHVQKGGAAKPYLIIEPEDVIIPAIDVAAEDLNAGLPTESFTLNFGKIKYTYIS